MRPFGELPLSENVPFAEARDAPLNATPGRLLATKACSGRFIDDPGCLMHRDEILPSDSASNVGDDVAMPREEPTGAALDSASNAALHLHAANGWLLVRRFHRLGGRSRPSTLDSAVPFAADLDRG